MQTIISAETNNKIHRSLQYIKKGDGDTVIIKDIFRPHNVFVSCGDKNINDYVNSMKEYYDFNDISDKDIDILYYINPFNGQLYASAIVVDEDNNVIYQVNGEVTQ